ncbi:MAG: hypothetical protein A2044_03900 [Candidatus Firestonebacteria bacterium GWA2_43_8]|nr:MAG: hypothetical protein A2044_03900 [Candidatus Firestonebacteria bacterium GWA2_43_8]
MTKNKIIVLSRWQGKDNKKIKYEDALIKELSGYNVSILLIPHIYYLKNNYSFYKKILKFKGEILICSWLFPRASEWVMNKELDTSGKKAVKYFSFLKYKKPGELVSVLKIAVKSEKSGKALIEDISKIPAVERWYPVVDYSKCRNCKKCLEFCVFGVYSLGEKKKINVENPGKCKPGCPACSRVCPHGAIMFPHYFDDDKICGGRPEKNEKKRF